MRQHDISCRSSRLSAYEYDVACVFPAIHRIDVICCRLLALSRKPVAKFVGKRALRRRLEQEKQTQFRYRGGAQPAIKIERHVKEVQKSIDQGAAPSPTEGEFISSPRGVF